MMAHTTKSLTLTIAACMSAITTLVLAAFAASPTHPPGVAVMHDAIVDPAALNFEHGPFGTAINGQTYQYPAITTFSGWQYATWFDGSRRLCVGRRPLPAGAWQIVAFDDYRINHVDVHNVSVIGICPLDGSIHLAFDHHNNPLRYRRTQGGAAITPEKIAWNTTLFGATASELVKGEKIVEVTYPAFVVAPDGRLQLFYRVGGSGRGDGWLAEYDPRRDGWTVLGKLIDRHGNFRGSDSRSAYPNGFDYEHVAARARLHTTWVWREGLDNTKPEGGLLNCHDLMYAWSDDFGRTWRNNDGERIGVAGSEPMHLNSPNVTVRDLPYKWGIMNQVTQTVDRRGRVHVVLWQQPPDAAAGSRDMNTWRYFHYWRETNGRWFQRQLPFVGRKPTVHADAHDNLYLVFNKGETAAYHGQDPGGRLHIATASAQADAWSDWRVVWNSPQRFTGEPRVDAARWANDGVLSVYVQEHPAKPGDSSALHTIDFTVDGR